MLPFLYAVIIVTYNRWLKNTTVVTIFIHFLYCVGLIKKKTYLKTLNSLGGRAFNFRWNLIFSFGSNLCCTPCFEYRHEADQWEADQRCSKIRILPKKTFFPKIFADPQSYGRHLLDTRMKLAAMICWPPSETQTQQGWLSFFDSCLYICFVDTDVESMVGDNDKKWSNLLDKI